MKKPYIYFVLKKNCNLKCKHCYLDAGPKKRDSTMDYKDFKKVVANLPQIALEISLTGGEIITMRKNLDSYLEHLQKENKKRKKERKGRIKVELQTNGFWATSKKRTEKTLVELASKGVNSLDITSNDMYHWEQGLDPGNIERIKKCLDTTEILEKYLIRGSTEEDVYPIGRAKENGFDTSTYNHDFDYCSKGLDKYDLTIHPQGEVYLCCLGLLKLKGNVINEKLVEIVRRARKDPMIKKITEYGIEEIALKAGWDDEEIEEVVNKSGNCGLCSELYKQGILDSYLN